MNSQRYPQIMRHRAILAGAPVIAGTRTSVRAVTAGREHFGIIVSAQKLVGRLLRELLAFLRRHSAEEVKAQLFCLKGASADR